MVERVSDGNYCVVATDISSAEVPAAVTVDWGGTSSPEGNASAMIRATGCEGGGFHVITERQPDIGGGAAGNAVEVNNVGFTIVIP